MWFFFVVESRPGKEGGWGGGGGLEELDVLRYKIVSYVTTISICFCEIISSYGDERRKTILCPGKVKL